MIEFRRKSPFQVGKSLSEDAESYIRRPADRRILELLREGELCLLLAPRQCGKSSLLLRAKARLREERFAVAYVDLQKCGRFTDPNSWFFSVADKIATELKIPGNVGGWWKEHSDFTPTYRFDRFMENVVLGEIAGRVVVLFDEVDSVLKMPFSDDFFIGIRAMVNASASDPAFRRLTMALAGMARPTEFVKDRSRTPFNVGQSVPVEDFSIQELQFFLDVLGAGSRPLVERILKWTGGQPILTQYLAATAHQWPEDERDPERLDEFVKRHVLNQPIDLDHHFNPIREFALEEAGPLSRVLTTYRKVLAGRKLVYNDRDPVHESLVLVGLVREKDGRLAIRNEIYRRVFDKGWIRKNTPRNPYRTAAIGASAALVATLLWFLLLQPMLQPDFRPLQMYDFEWYDREITYTEVPNTELDVRFPATPIKKIVLVRTGPDKTEKTDIEMPTFEEGPKLEGRVRTFSVPLKALTPQENKFELRFFGVWGEPSYQTRIVAAYWPREKWGEIHPEMVAIPPGEFMMGQTEEETRQLREVVQQRKTAPSGGPYPGLPAPANGSDPGTMGNGDGI